MPSWKEQLQQIQNLRLQNKQQDEQLHAVQIQLQKIISQLKKSAAKETSLPVDRQKIAGIRNRIGGLEKELQQLNQRLNNLNATFEKIRAIEDNIAFLEKKITVVQKELDKVSRKLEEEQRNNKPDKKLIEELAHKIEGLSKLLRSLNQDLSAAQKIREGLLLQQEAARVQQDVIIREKGAVNAQINQLQIQLSGLLNAGGNNHDSLEGEKIKLEEEGNRIKTGLNETKRNLHDLRGSIFANPHPRDAMANLDDGIPFLLMPVRIETRFITSGSSPALCLRIYPDEIAIHTHEKILTDKEVQEGEKYWIEIFNAEKESNTDKEDRKKTAWSNLTSFFGPQRSAWVALQTKPENWSNDLSSVITAADLVFPVHDVTSTSSWSRAPRTYVQPDKFVVILYEGETVTEIPGNVIPDELFLGPDPMDAANAFQTRENKLVFGESFNWTSDFVKAISVGMGFRIPLTATQATNGFDKILVLGVYLSADETAGKEILEELIDNHHYSPKGFSVVLQGTPTNNTDQNGSGYTRNDAFNNTSYVVETGEPLFREDENCDGRNLADALGIEYAPLQYILNSDGTDQKETIAINKALYPATLGYYFGTMLQPVLSETVQDTLREFFTRYVTGRGPVPAIRVGDQPYGILLTSDFSKWDLGKHSLVFQAPFYQTLLNLLRHYEKIWKGLLPALNYVGKEGTDPSALLMDILGLHSSSVEFFQRNAYSTENLENLDQFQYGGTYFNALRNNLESKSNLLGFFNDFGFRSADIQPAFTTPQLLRLVYQHYTSTLDAANLVDNVPLSEDKWIRYYDADGEKNYLDWLAEADSPEILEAQDFGTGKTAPNALLYLMLRKALLEQLHKSSVEWLSRNNIKLEYTLKARNFHNIRPGGDITKWEVMKAPVGAAVPDHVSRNKSVAAHLLTTGADENEARFLNEVRAAISELSRVYTARLERCFTEHLDSCTYRLDAWQSALFNMRLEEQRQIPGDDRSSRRKGIYMGAYGWVENVRPSGKRLVANDVISEKLRPGNEEPLFVYDDNGGFVHAPSINHASAAAILRSGYLSHANADHPDMMAVNLSSERVRNALFILRGIQEGQSLEALLGYQFERGLHDRGSADNSLMKLNGYIYDFRDAFPIEQHKVLQQGSNEGAESIPAYNVVNGVTLAENNSEFPFGATGGVVMASSAEQDAIRREKDRLRDTLDAVKDLLLSEGVYQLVLGNFDRAGAVINGLRDSHIPPEIDVISTPRSSHFTFTNRVTIQFENLDPNQETSNPWHPIPMTLRAAIEPGLNKWVKSILGEPGNLICKVWHEDESGAELDNEIVSADKLSLQPVDLIYITGNELNTGANKGAEEALTSVSELESRVAYYYRRNYGLDDATNVRIQFLPAEGHPGKRTFSEMLPLFRMIKSLITDSRHLHAEDFDPTSKQSISDPGNPKGYDVTNLRGRVEGARNSFRGYLEDLNNIPVQLAFTNEDGLQTFTNLGDSFRELDNANLDLSDTTITFNSAGVSQLQETLIYISNSGIPNAFPRIASAITEENKLILLGQARNIARIIAKAKTDADDLFNNADAIPETDSERKALMFVEAGKRIFGGGFNIIPLFTYNNESDIQYSHNDESQLLDYARNNLKMSFVTEEWLQNVSHVRPKLMRWDCIRTLNETFNEETLALNPIQLPYRAYDSWVAVQFPETHKEVNDDGELVDMPFNITHDILSIVVNGYGAFLPASKQSGLLIDDFTEVIPAKEEITGITFNYNQPNAMPPQALLLAVTPVVTGHWNWDDLVGTLNDTLLRAKLRAVDTNLLDGINKPEVSVLLPALLANFTQSDLDISLDMRTNVSEFNSQMPITSIY